MTHIPALLLALSALAFAAPAEARMYQWVNPDSGRTQFSGQPPAWYRAATGGPRVFVFENGKLIDDTAVRVSEEHRMLLRQEAFSGTTLDEHAVAVGEDGAADPETPVVPDMVDALSEAAPEAAAEPTAGTEATIDRLKSIIEDWDRARTEQAKAVIETENRLDALIREEGLPPTAP